MRVCVCACVCSNTQQGRGPTTLYRCRITLARCIAGGDENAAMGDASQVAGELSDVAHPAGGRGPVVVHRVGGGEHGGGPREDGRGRAARESYVCGRTWSWEEENK